MPDPLDDFLGDPGPAAAQPEPVAPERPAPEPVAAEPEQTAAPEPAAETERHDDDAAPVPESGTVPVAALAAERKARQDYKTKAAALEGELSAIKAELEASRRAQADAALKAAAPPPAPVAAPTPPPAPVPVPSAIEDPEGFQAHIQKEMRASLFEERLNVSELAVRDKFGDEDVDEKLKVYKELAAKKPELAMELGRQLHPWKWMYETAKREIELEEVGPDLSVYRAKIETESRAKIEAEIRAQIEAEYAAKEPEPVAAAAPRAPLPPASIGAARSAAPRNAVTWTGPPDFDDILRGRGKGA